MKAKLLVVDDDPGVVEYLVEMLQEEGFQVEGHTDPEQALRRIEERPFDLVISDVEMPRLNGTALLERARRSRPDQLVLLITAFGSIDLAVRAVRAGACDFVTKPFGIEVLVLAIERALRERQLQREVVRLSGAGPEEQALGAVARSPSMRRVLELARRAAQVDSQVLLTGESGTGKGFLARLIHDHGPRAAGPFVQVNCAALPGALVESELFGVSRGAFTDARADRPGLFQQAAGGSLFLDEVGELPLDSQAKLLQSLESGRVRPLGSAREVETDVRILTATNRPLEEALRERSFRPDLYYRLNVIRLELPPLRQRQEDIEPLVALFLERANRQTRRPVKGISPEGMRWILAQAWPGNVRELANAIERGVVLCEGEILGPADLTGLAEPTEERASLQSAARQGLSLAEVERRYIEEVVASNEGNKASAARILGIDRRTLYRRLGEAEEG